MARNNEWLVIYGRMPNAEAYGGVGNLWHDSGLYLIGRLTIAVFEEDKDGPIEAGCNRLCPFSIALPPLVNVDV